MNNVGKKKRRTLKKKKEYGIGLKGIVSLPFTHGSFIVWLPNRKKAGIKGSEGMKDVKGGQIPRALIITTSFQIVQRS